MKGVADREGQGDKYLLNYLLCARTVLDPLYICPTRILKDGYNYACLQMRKLTLKMGTLLLVTSLQVAALASPLGIP